MSIQIVETLRSCPFGGIELNVERDHGLGRVEIAYAGRTLAHDSTAAKRWATIMTKAAAKGHPRPAIDTMVAAIASVHDMTVVTRSVEHLKYTGVPVLNPSESEQKENPNSL